MQNALGSQSDKNSQPAEADWAKFFVCLNADRAEAERIYFEIRAKTVKRFALRGFFNDAEDLAFEVFRRIVKGCAEITDAECAQRIAAAQGYALNLMREKWREQKRRREIWIEAEETVDAPELRVNQPLGAREKREIIQEEKSLRQKKFDCAKTCFEKLKAADKDLIGEYAVLKRGDETEIAGLARKHNLAVPYLRVRVFRIRKKLRKCEKECCAK